MENSTMKTGNPIANEEDFQKVANKVSTITIIGNIALSLLKLFCRNCCAFQCDDQRCYSFRIRCIQYICSYYRNQTRIKKTGQRTSLWT